MTRETEKLGEWDFTQKVKFMVSAYKKKKKIFRKSLLSQAVES